MLSITLPDPFAHINFQEKIHCSYSTGCIIGPYSIDHKIYINMQKHIKSSLFIEMDKRSHVMAELRLFTL